MTTEPRRRGIDPLFTPEQLLTMSAQEVSDATQRAVETLRYCDSFESLASLAKDISETTKKNQSQARRQKALEDIANRLMNMDILVMRRHLVPAVTHVVRTSSFISTPRKAMVVKQLKEVVSRIDQVMY